MISSLVKLIIALIAIPLIGIGLIAGTVYYFLRAGWDLAIEAIRAKHNEPL